MKLLAHHGNPVVAHPAIFGEDGSKLKTGSGEDLRWLWKLTALWNGRERTRVAVPQRLAILLALTGQEVL